MDQGNRRLLTTGCPGRENGSGSSERQLHSSWHTLWLGKPRAWLTTSTLELLHPLLSNESLGSLCKLLYAAEASGDMPCAHTDFRPVGLYRGFFRVWAKVRRDYVQTWQNTRGDHPAFAGSRDRTTVDTFSRTSATCTYLKTPFLNHFERRFSTSLETTT